jgi:vacuolar protein sorting-associated protein 13A/C
MFSYDTDDRKNRALIRVGTSGWSPPQSFEAVGQASEAIIPKEYEDELGDSHLGINIERGLGQYKLSKIITIRPRFVVESFLEDAIYFRQPGAKDFAVLEPGAQKEILVINNEVPRLSLRFGDSNRNKWYTVISRSLFTVGRILSISRISERFM